MSESSDIQSEIFLKFIIDWHYLIAFIHVPVTVVDQNFRGSLGKDIVFIALGQFADGGHSFPGWAERDDVDDFFGLTDLAKIISIFEHKLQ